MHFTEHSELTGKHAYLSASQYHWINYTEDKLRTSYLNNLKKEEGTMLHAFASIAIQKRIKLAPLKKALHLFVNDCIGFKMESEQILYYSDNCFGTADAISFHKKELKIFDLKTGITKPSFKQLDIYAALFCLEYNKNPHKITIEQRIYQGNGYQIGEPDPFEIERIINQIVTFDKILEGMESTI